MDNCVRSKIEKVLKKNLKRKVSYSLGLLVSFLISGALLYANTANLAQSAAALDETLEVKEAVYQEDLRAEIERVKAMMAENRARRAEIWFDYQELIRKGDFFSKPIYPSTQTFWTAGYEHNGWNKNVTKSEWKSTIAAVTVKMSPYSDALPKGKNPYHAGEVIAYANGSMQAVNTADGYSYNTTGIGRQLASYDSTGYNPNITPETLDDNTAEKYLKPEYVTDKYGNVLQTTGTPAGVSTGTPDLVYKGQYFYYEMINGEQCLVDASGKAVEVDGASGNPVMVNSLLDPNINGTSAGKRFMAAEEPEANTSLVTGNGVYIKNRPNEESIDVGATLKPLYPYIPDVKKTVTVDVSTPQLGGIPNAPSAPSAPAAVSVSVTAPVVTVTAPGAVGAINPITPSSKTPNSPGSLNVNLPDALTIAEFEPQTILPPTAPNAPTVTLPTLPTFSLSGQSGGNTDAAFYFDDGGQNSKITGIAITAGNFVLNRSGTNLWNYTFSGYDGVNIGAGNTAADDDFYPGDPVGKKRTGMAATMTTGTDGTQNGFLRTVNNPMYTAATIEYNYTPGATIASSNFVKELVHQDTHGAQTATTLNTRLGSTGASGVNATAATLSGYGYAQDYMNPVGNANTWTQNTTPFINAGTINMNGS
ncbi:MAG: hypothetical protein LBQ96_02540, partial [Fusobacteriaceae bacterium]|nr:hypothetical protein [Fusobacteriaceae bacterium]